LKVAIVLWVSSITGLGLIAEWIVVVCATVLSPVIRFILTYLFKLYLVGFFFAGLAIEKIIVLCIIPTVQYVLPRLFRVYLVGFLLIGFAVEVCVVVCAHICVQLLRIMRRMGR